MKRIFFPFIPLLLLGALLSMGCTGSVFGKPTDPFAGPSYTGTYTLTSGEVSLTLRLTQHPDNSLEGTLSSTTGASYQLQGKVEEGIALGICYSEQEKVFFEAYLEGTTLTLSLIEADSYNMPDYNTAVYYQFEKQLEGTGPVEIPAPSVATPVPEGTTIQDPTLAPKVKEGNVKVGPGEAGDPFWGFKFTVPEGWTHKQTAESILLGSHTVAGLIIVFPHQVKSIQQVQQELSRGLQEENISLSLSGSVKPVANHILTGDYTGVVEGQTAKAKAYGSLSPYGGGAFIIAVSTPEGFSDALAQTAEKIIKEMVYIKQDVSELMQHFVGTWTHFTTNTSTWITFHPDGTFSDQYEASYQGNFEDQYGVDAGNWGVAGQESDRGRWAVYGNKDEGRIVVRYANGKEVVYNYRVNIEKGRKFYNNYYLNGDFYFKK